MSTTRLSDLDFAGEIFEFEDLLAQNRLDHLTYPTLTAMKEDASLEVNDSAVINGGNFDVHEVIDVENEEDMTDPNTIYYYNGTHYDGNSGNEAIGFETVNGFAILNDKNTFITPKMFGAVGNGIIDDTDAIQKCFDYAAKHGNEIVFSAGRYKITSKVSIKWDKITNVRKKSQKISGSGINAFEDVYDSCVIIAYNIGAFDCAVEISGNSNVHAPSIELNDIAIVLDENTCDDNAFCMLFGDSWVSAFNRVKFSGKNGLILRCGSFDGGSYADVDLNFKNCVFNATSDKGFGLLPERWLNGLGQPVDALKFDSCYINGVMGIDASEMLASNCLSTFRMTKTTEPRNDIQMIAGYNINYKTAFLVGSGKNVKFEQCYNEDFSSFVTVLPVGGIVWNVTIDDCYCNSPSNQYHNGVRYRADNCVKVIPNTSQSTWRLRNLRINNLLCRTYIDSTEGAFPFLDGYEIITNNKVDRCIITNSYDHRNGKISTDLSDGILINDLIQRSPCCLNLSSFSYANGWHVSNGNETDQMLFSFGNMYLSKVILRNVDDFVTFQIRDENNVLIQEVGKAFFTKMANNVYSFEFGSNTFPMSKLPEKCYLTIYAGRTSNNLPSADLYVYM